MIRETEPAVYGLLAEFTQPEQVLDAARRARAEGYRQMDAYTPFPVHGLSEAVGFRKTRVPLIVLLGGLTGCIGGFLLQYIYRVEYYPMNIGGRPHNSFVAFIIIMFELTILCAAFSAVVGMLALNGLPQPYHPLFNVPRFGLASRDRFFLSIEAKDPKFDLDTTRQFLQGLNPVSVDIVPTAPVKPVEKI